MNFSKNNVSVQNTSLSIYDKLIYFESFKDYYVAIIFTRGNASNPEVLCNKNQRIKMISVLNRTCRYKHTNLAKLMSIIDKFDEKKTAFIQMRSSNPLTVRNVTARHLFYDFEEILQPVVGDNFKFTAKSLQDVIKDEVWCEKNDEMKKLKK